MAAGGIGSLGRFTVAPPSLQGSMAALGNSTQGSGGADNPVKDMPALQNLQFMDRLFNKERIFLLAQFWQQVREDQARAWCRCGSGRHVVAEPRCPSSPGCPSAPCKHAAPRLYCSPTGLRERARLWLGRGAAAGRWRRLVATVEARLTADRCGGSPGRR